MNVFELLDGPIPPVLVAVRLIPTEPDESPGISPGAPPEVIGRRLSESEILELWQERSCIIHGENVELVEWCESQGFTIEQTWRYCQLCAAADMSLTRGSYVESTIFKEIKGTKNAITN